MRRRIHNKGRGRPPRPHKIVLRLNEREYNALKDYTQQYAIENTAEWIRGLIMTEVIGRIERDTPLLFSEEEMGQCE